MRRAIEELPASKIREVANAGIGRSDVLAFWFGESDEATPAPVGEAVARAIAAGATRDPQRLTEGVQRLARALRL